MKNLLKNTLLFVALSIVFSNLTACTKTATTNSNGAVIGVAPNASNTANPAKTSPEVADGNYPPAPEAILQTENKDLDGKVLKIDDYKGKVVLVNLWAIFCPPCRAEMPEIVAMQEKYKDKGFQVVGLNASDPNEETVDDVNKFAKDMKLNYKLAYADQKVINAFIKVTKLEGIPQTILINREGKMIGVFPGGGQQKVNEMKAAVDKAMSDS